MFRAVACLFAVSLVPAIAPAVDPRPAWEVAVDAAAAKPPMTTDEVKAFIRMLTAYARDYHLKTGPQSEQRGMVYEYFDPSRKGHPDQWVQGEALDTMHDGAWFAIAMANAHRATGDPAYRAFLRDWSLSFYGRMLNGSDTLFSTQRVDVAATGVRFGKEHQLQPGEKGFVPYWWDDGASVSLERRKAKDGRAKPPFACTDRLADADNPQARLSGYSHGSSNHLAQDLGPMLMLGWLLFRASADPAERTLAAELAEAAKNLDACRGRHGSPNIPAVAGPAALLAADAARLAKVAVGDKPAVPTNHYTRLLRAAADKRESTPGFADDTLYGYYAALAKYGADLPNPVLLKLVYDAYTQPMAYRAWSDTAAVPPGVNRFDLGPPLYARGGKFESYRSDRAAPIGSRMGPQNMVVCGWALQALAAHPGLWDDAVKSLFPKDVTVPFLPTGSAYAIDGRPDVTAAEPFDVGGVTLRLASHRDALIVHGATSADGVTVELFAGPDATGETATVTLKTGQPVMAAGPDGKPLRVTGVVLGKKGEPSAFEFAVPYTVVKDQGRWANGVEMGRYSVRVGRATRNFVLASREADVRAGLERELAGGLRTWEAIFAAKGFIPTGLGASREWDAFSDSGGYAHLISAASQYVLWKAGRRDWDVHRVPRVK